MKIEYETTIDEMITTNMLWLRGTGTFKNWIAWGIIYWVGAVALVIFVSSSPLINKLLVGFIMGGALGGPVIFNHKSMIRNKMRKMLVKKHGSDKPVPAALQIADGKIEYSSNHANVAFQLSALSSVEEIEDGIYLDFTNSNVLYIPNTAFESEEERNAWKAKITEGYSESENNAD